MGFINRNYQPPLLDSEEEKRLKVNQFKGVDYTTSPLDMSDNRSIDMLNYIRKNNVLEKRNGINGILNFENPIYDIWRFLDCLIIHTGSDIYVYKLETFEFLKSFKDCVLPKKIMAFVSGERLYILGGVNYLVLQKKKNKISIIGQDSGFELLKASDIAYIPTTTIGINQENYEGVTSRTTLDDQNLLVDRVVNELIGGSSIKTYYLKDNTPSQEVVEDSDKFETPNIITSYKLDRAIEINDETLSYKQLPKINIRYNWEDIIKIMLKYSGSDKDLYEFEESATIYPVTTISFAIICYFVNNYKNYNPEQIKLIVNKNGVSNTYTPFINSMNYIVPIDLLTELGTDRKKTLSYTFKARYLKEDATVGDEPLSESNTITKDITLRKYKQRYYLNYGDTVFYYPSNESLFLNGSIIFLNLATSKYNDFELKNIEIYYKGKQIKNILETGLNANDFIWSNGIKNDDLENERHFPSNNVFWIFNKKENYDIGYKKTTILLKIFISFAENDPRPYTNFFDQSNPNTYIKVNGKRITFKTNYLGKDFEENLDNKNFEWLVNANKGVGVEYDD